jgi:hydrogenase/urease accessory protein HupE
LNRRNLIPWLTISLLASAIQAHTISLTYAEIAVNEQEVRWSLRVPLPEMDLLLGLDRNHDGQVDAAEIDRSRNEIQHYLLTRLGVKDDGREVAGSIGNLRPWKDSEGHPFIETEAVFAAPGGKFDHLTLRCDMLRDVVASHQTLAKITVAGQTREFVFTNGQSFQVDARLSAFAAFLQFVKMGVLHIFTGYDHIAFLLGLVLIGGSLKTILKVVTSFTVAHSITLALAALNIVELPSRLVESGIALSIMYVALENLFFKTFDRRWLITFFFGLIHGFGFASALQEVHLSRNLLATALFSFNFGVELGQLCIVSVMLPTLLYLSRHRFNTIVVRACSVAIFAIGSVWFWQRIRGG